MELAEQWKADFKSEVKEELVQGHRKFEENILDLGQGLEDKSSQTTKDFEDKIETQNDITVTSDWQNTLEMGMDIFQKVVSNKLKFRSTS